MKFLNGQFHKMSFENMIENTVARESISREAALRHAASSRRAQTGTAHEWKYAGGRRRRRRRQGRRRRMRESSSVGDGVAWLQRGWHTRASARPTSIRLNFAATLTRRERGEISCRGSLCWKHPSARATCTAKRKPEWAASRFARLHPWHPWIRRDCTTISRLPFIRRHARSRGNWKDGPRKVVPHPCAYRRRDTCADPVSRLSLC